MNFQKIAPVPNPKDLLNVAFSRARAKSYEKPIRGKGEFLDAVKRKESMKFDIIKDNIITKLEKVLSDFPKESDLPSFYVKLIHLTIGYVFLKKSFGAIDWAINKVKFFQKDYARKMHFAQDKQQIEKISKEYYGRISSVLKQITENLSYLEEARRIMRTYPDVKEMFTVCIYGFPNVGKSTFLNKLTGSKAEVAPYAFTTKTINAGYLNINDQKVQILDVPGTLARKEKMNVIELQAELVVKELANIIIYVFDLSEYSGYSFKKQEQLYKNLSKDKKILIYVSKLDITDLEIVKEFEYPYYSVEEIKDKIQECLLASNYLK